MVLFYCCQSVTKVYSNSVRIIPSEAGRAGNYPLPSLSQADVNADAHVFGGRLFCQSGSFWIKTQGRIGGTCVINCYLCGETTIWIYAIDK